MTPHDRGLERLLTRHHRAAAAGKEPEPIVERVGDAARVHHADPRCRELQRQREAVEPSADPRDGLELLLVGCEAAPRLTRPLHEEGLRSLVVERRNPPRDFPGDTERLAARRHHAEIGHADEERVEHVGGPVEHLLAVVEHEERVAVAQLLHQRVDERPVALLSQAHGPGDRRRDEFRVPHRGEVHPPHPAGMTIGGIARRLRAQAAFYRTHRCR